MDNASAVSETVRGVPAKRHAAEDGGRCARFRRRTGEAPAAVAKYCSMTDRGIRPRSATSIPYSGPTGAPSPGHRSRGGGACRDAPLLLLLLLRRRSGCALAGRTGRRCCAGHLRCAADRRGRIAAAAASLITRSTATTGTSGLVALVAVVLGVAFFATSHPLRGTALLIIAAIAAGYGLVSARRRSSVRN